MTLTPYPLLLPWSRKSRAMPLFPLWAVGPVRSLGACTRVHFTFTFVFLFIRYSSINYRISSLHGFVFKICVNKQVYNKIMTTKMASQIMRMRESSCDFTHKRNLIVTAPAVVQTQKRDSQGSVVFIGISPNLTQ